MRYCPTWTQLPLDERIIVIISVGFAAAAALFFSGWIDGEMAVDLIKFAGVGTLALTVVVTGFSAHQVIQRSCSYNLWIRQLWKSRSLLLVWVCCVVVSTSIFPAGNRILMDEVIVLATSKAIHEEKEPVTPTRLESYSGIHKLSFAYIDKRPYFYATIVALFHDIAGYSPKNAFFANMVLSAATLALLGFLGTRLGGSATSGAVAMLALTSVPLFCEHATGGGIDITNLFALCLVLAFAVLHLEAPSVPAARGLMAASVLLAYARYESMIFMALPAVIFMLNLRRTGKLHLDWAILVVLPALLPLCGIHYLTFLRPADAFQLAEKGLTEPFSLSYIPGNLSSALSFFFNREHLLTNSIVIFCAGVVALLLLIVSLGRRYQRKTLCPLDAAFWTFASIVVAGFAVLMAYSWGKLDDVVASRLSLPLYLLFSLSIGMLTREVSKPYAFGFAASLACAGSIYWSSFPLAAKRYGFQMYPSAGQLARLDEFVERQPDRYYAVVNNITNYWLTRDVYAVTPGSLRGNSQFVANMLKSGEFRRIYLIQSLKKDPVSGVFVMNPRDEITLPIETELLSEDLVNGELKLRISLIHDRLASKVESLR
jgi:hypothetical protein